MSAHVFTDRSRSHAGYPDIASYGNNLLCAWLESDGRDDVVKIAMADPSTGVMSGVTSLTAAGSIAYTPRVFVSGTTADIVWTEYSGDAWSVRCVTMRDSGFSPARALASGFGAFDPVIVRDDARGLHWMFFTKVDRGGATVMGIDLSAGGAAPVNYSEGIAYAARPEAAVGRDGAIWLAFDGIDGVKGHGYRVYVRRIGPAGPGERLALNDSTDWATRPAIAALGNGALVTWYESGRGNVNTYWSAEILHEGGRLIARKVRRIDRTHNWLCWTALAPNHADDSIVFVFSRGWRSIGMRSYANGAWSEERRVPLIGDTILRRARAAFSGGKLAVIWQRSEGNGHRERLSDVGITIENGFHGFPQAPEIDNGNEFNLPVAVAKRLDSPDPEAIRAWRKSRLPAFRDAVLLWGDIHGQSGLSDGQGEVDEYFAFARDVAKLDFTALTDHDCFPNILSPGEWEYSRTVSNALNKPGDIVTIVALEWTSNEYRHDYGHKNIYFPGESGRLFRSTDTATDDPPKLFAALKPEGAICIPHHPAAMWSTASAATDWSYHDGEVQRLVEILSRHAPFEIFGNRSVYTKNVSQAPGHSVVDALARGYRLGIIAGSDSHQLEHGIEGGILAAYARAPDRDGIFSALRDRLVYATTGARIMLEFDIDGTPMGAEMPAAPTSSPEAARAAPVVSFRCLAPSVIETVDFITDHGVIKSCKVDDVRFETDFTIGPESDISWMYARVTQYDHHMAWSSPVWLPEKGKS